MTLSIPLLSLSLCLECLEFSPKESFNGSAKLDQHEIHANEAELSHAKKCGPSFQQHLLFSVVSPVIREMFW